MTLHIRLGLWQILKLEESCESVANLIYNATVYDDLWVGYSNDDVHTLHLRVLIGGEEGEEHQHTANSGPLTFFRPF